MPLGFFDLNEGRSTELVLADVLGSTEFETEVLGTTEFVPGFSEGILGVFPMIAGFCPG